MQNDIKPDLMYLVSNVTKRLTPFLVKWMFPNRYIITENVRPSGTGINKPKSCELATSNNKPM